MHAHFNAACYVYVGYPHPPFGIGIISVIHSITKVQFVRKLMQLVDFHGFTCFLFCLIFHAFYIFRGYVHRIFPGSESINIVYLVFSLRLTSAQLAYNYPFES